MGDVVRLPVKTRRAVPKPNRSDKRSFLCCSCSADEGTGWVPIVISDSEGWSICGLACMGCAREMQILNGREVR